MPGQKLSALKTSPPAIAGADDFVAMANRARQHTDWLGQYLDLSAGIPSHDRLNMIFRRLNPAEFERCLLSWLGTLHDTSAGRLLAIDGKTARQSFDKATAKSALHMVSVWAVSQRLNIGPKDHAAANLGVLRRMGVSLLKNETSQNVGIKNRRLVAAWNTRYLEKVVFGQ